MEGEVVISAIPFLKVFSQVICWGFFLIVIVVLRNFIIKGFSMAIAETLLNMTDGPARERMTRWLGNQKKILACLKEIDKKMGRQESPVPLEE